MKNLTSTTLLIIVLILSFFLFKECEKNKQEYGKPKDLISVDQATAYEKNYINHQFKYINDSLNVNGVQYKDSRAFRFTIEKLENYIHYVKEEAKNKDLDGELSLRIYLGAKKTKFNNEEHSIMRTRLFLVPTHREIIRNTEAPHENIKGLSPLNFGSSGDPDDIKYNVGN